MSHQMKLVRIYLLNSKTIPITGKGDFIQDNIENTVVKEVRLEINISSTSGKLQHFQPELFDNRVLR